MESTCVLLGDGTARCWGQKYEAMAGDVVEPGQELTTRPVTVAGLRGASVLALGVSYACAVVGGSALCWGNNNALQQESHVTPFPEPGVDGVVALAVSFMHACALRGDGRVVCWGDNLRGALGRGDENTKSAGIVPGVEGAVAVGTGSKHTCAVLGDGTARCWGTNTYGQLGDGTQLLRRSSTPVKGLANAVNIALGDTTEVGDSLISSHFTCALLRDGTVQCWGDNRRGQLGDGSAAPMRLAPAPVVGLRGVVEIASGTEFTCALLDDGTVRCWGDNRRGQLGDGTRVHHARPTAVSGLRDVVGIAARGLHACALTAAQQVLCWGSNSNRELGDGTNAHRSTRGRRSLPRLCVSGRA